MKKILLLLTLLVNLMYSTQINWNKDYKSALIEAKNTNKPILMVVETPYCPYCELLKEEVLSDSVVANFISDNFVALKVQQNDGTYPLETFSVYGTPTTFFINKNAEPYLGSIIGYVKKDKYLEYLKIGLDNKKE